MCHGAPVRMEQSDSNCVKIAYTTTCKNYLARSAQYPGLAPGGRHYRVQCKALELDRRKLRSPAACTRQLPFQIFWDHLRYAEIT